MSFIADQEENPKTKEKEICTAFCSIDGRTAGRTVGK